MKPRPVVLCAWCGNEGKWSRNGRGGSFMCGRCRRKSRDAVWEKLERQGRQQMNNTKREDEELKA